MHRLESQRLLEITVTEIQNQRKTKVDTQRLKLSATSMAKINPQDAELLLKVFKTFTQ